MNNWFKRMIEQYGEVGPIEYLVAIGNWSPEEAAAETIKQAPELEDRYDWLVDYYENGKEVETLKRILFPDAAVG